MKPPRTVDEITSDSLPPAFPVDANVLDEAPGRGEGGMPSDLSGSDDGTLGIFGDDEHAGEVKLDALLFDPDREVEVIDTQLPSVEAPHSMEISIEG